MTTTVIGPQRLFDVAPGAITYEVRDHTVRLVRQCPDLATAVIAAAGTAAATGHPAWIIAPDRWATAITTSAEGWTLDATSTGTPIDAIRRVLNITPTTGDTDQ